MFAACFTNNIFANVPSTLLKFVFSSAVKKCPSHFLEFFIGKSFFKNKFSKNNPKLKNGGRQKPPLFYLALLTGFPSVPPAKGRSVFYFGFSSETCKVADKPPFASTATLTAIRQTKTKHFTMVKNLFAKQAVRTNIVALIVG